MPRAAANSRGADRWLDPPGTEGWWEGVTVQGGHVVKLDLSMLGLRGDLPAEIGQLTYLRELDLHSFPSFSSLGMNYITGIPPELGDLQKLKVLYLYANQVEFLPPSSVSCKI